MAESTQLSPQFLSLLRSCLVLALLIHLPFLGMVIGGSTVSLLLNLLGRDKGKASYLRLSRELIDTVAAKKSLFFLFGILPLFPVALIYRQTFVGASLLPKAYWFLILGALFAGYLFLSFYRATFSFAADLPTLSIGAGFLGLLTLIGGFFLLVMGTGIAFNPEKLPFLQNRALYYLSWNSIVKFFLYMALFFGTAAGAVHLFVARRREGETEYPGYGELVSKVGSTTALAASASVPIFLVFNLITLPDVALSLSVYGFTVLVLLILMALCVFLFRTARTGGTEPSPLVFVSYILVFLALLAGDAVAMENAYRQQRSTLTMREAAQKAERAKPAVSAREEAEEEADGEAVFQRICAGCHRFDERVVGPPLMEVLPKYAGDEEKLAAFIRAPVKVDPDYPPMPKLSITEGEIEAVVDYLFSRFEK